MVEQMTDAKIRALVEEIRTGVRQGYFTEFAVENVVDLCIRIRDMRNGERQLNNRQSLLCDDVDCMHDYPHGKH